MSTSADEIPTNRAQDVTDAGGFTASTPDEPYLPIHHDAVFSMDSGDETQFALEISSPVPVASTPPPQPAPQPSPQPSPSELKEDAGPILIHKQAPRHLSSTASARGTSGGAALFGYLPDQEVDEEEVFDSMDSAGSPDCFVFKPENANRAVHHFIMPVASDCTDAGGDANPDWNDPTQPGPSYQRQLSGAYPIQQSFLAVEQEFKYKMDHEERGCFMIFNQKYYDKKLDLKVRHGTERDAANLQNTAQKLGFEYVRVFDDCTKDEMMWWIKTLSTANHANYDCFVCCVLTHGGDNDVLYAKDEPFELKELTSAFRPDKCESLAGKPKLFFIQACRGFKLDDGAEKPKPVQSDAIDGIQLASYDRVDGNMEQVQTIPVEADFLIGHSTVKEYYSWRNESNGSIFIQNLCACLHKWGHSMELMQILTRVNRMTAYEFQSAAGDKKMDRKKQIPSITTRLTAEVYFGRKIRPEWTQTDHRPTEVVDPAARNDETYNVQNVPRITSNSDAPPSVYPETGAADAQWRPPTSSFYPPPLPPKTRPKQHPTAPSRSSPPQGSTPVKISTRKTSLTPNFYSSSADRGHSHMHHSQTTPEMRHPSGAHSLNRRSYPLDQKRLVVPTPGIQYGKNTVSKSYEETDV